MSGVQNRDPELRDGGVQLRVPPNDENTGALKQRINEYELRCNELEMEILRLQAERDSYARAYQEIQNATFWRISAPLRFVLSKIKTKLGINLPGIQAPIPVRAFRYLKKNGIRATLGRVWIQMVGYKPQSKTKSFISTVSYPNIQKKRVTNRFDFIYDNSKEEEPLDIFVSVIIPTKNGGNDFERLMKLLVHQKGIQKVEIVIVDSGSTDSTVKVAEQYGAKVISIKPEEFSHSYARNLGIKNALGEYALVMTQDAMPTSLYWIRNFYHAFASNEKIAAVSCGEFPRIDADLYHRAFTWNHYNFLGSYENDRINECPASQDVESMHRAAQLSDIACFMKRETALKYPYQGGFAEDLDLGICLLKDGFQIGFLGHELAIHSHNRLPYYYLKRRFVELMTLKKIFPNQDFIRTQYDALLCEIAYILEQLNNCFKKQNMEALSGGITYGEFKNSFMMSYKRMGNEKFNPYFVLDENEFTWIDAQTIGALKELFDACDAMKKEGGLYKGTMLRAMEGYLDILFNYMAECYEYINEEVFEEFRECIGKIFAGLIGTYFAYCNLTELENGEIIREHQAFYQKIGVGV